ncbi:helix-turn-helix domain-containing protein [Duganella sp. BuS-21]|uniref:helix-turn-helix domain-containing protein n=1 Tax=Duganella sp. BuS-21 TaxID=2943848 RepID=UPI0035A6FF22
METDVTLDVDQAAAMLHADRETVLNVARRGELPGTKIGKSWVFLRSNVLDYLKLRIEADTARRKQVAAATHAAVAVAVTSPQHHRRTKLPTLPTLPDTQRPRGRKRPPSP